MEPSNRRLTSHTSASMTTVRLRSSTPVLPSAQRSAQRNRGPIQAMRIPRPEGLRYLCLKYECADVVSRLIEIGRPMHGWVTIHVDSDDLSKVQVLDPDDDYAITLPCTYQRYTLGLSLQLHRRTLKTLRQQGLQCKEVNFLHFRNQLEISPDYTSANQGDNASPFQPVVPTDDSAITKSILQPDGRPFAQVLQRLAVQILRFNESDDLGEGRP